MAVDADATKDCSLSGLQILVSPNVTCGFAQKVATTWGGNNTKPEGVIYVESPTTGDTYGLRCSPGAHANVCVTSKSGRIWFVG